MRLSPRQARAIIASALEGFLSLSPRIGQLPRISSLQQSQIAELGCLEPIASDLHITPWTSADLTRHAMTEGIALFIRPRRVRRILHDVALQPHRTRYWKTSHLDAEFKERAEKILWSYANAGHLASQDAWIVW